MENPANLFNALSLVLALFSLVAIIISVISIRDTSRLTKKINSKEYQINEEIKYSLFQVIASVRSIDARAAVALDILRNQNIPSHIKKNYDFGFSHELDIFNKLQSSPGYLLFLESIKNTEERFGVECAFRNISMKMPLYDYSKLREDTHLLMRLIKSNISEELRSKDRLYKTMYDLCEMEGVYTNIDYDNLQKVKMEVMQFLDYLEQQGISNPEVGFSDDGIDPGDYQLEYEEFKKIYPIVKK